MFYFSKSKYCRLWQCPKSLWLDKYAPELRPEDTALQARMDSGSEVGDLAMGLFGPFVEVTAFKADGTLDLNTMKTRTAALMAEETPVICEASFDADGLYCAVDILRRDGNGWAIYEVKSATHVSPIYAVDLSYQKYVLEQCGVHVTGTYLVHLNGQYERGDTLDVQALFCVADLTEQVDARMAEVPRLLADAKTVYAMDTAPATDIGSHCRDPYACPFWDYCTRTLPTPSVFDLYRLGFEKALAFYRQGLVSFEQLLQNGGIKNAKQRRQMEHALHDQPPFIDKGGIGKFLDTLSFPLYFLDFETSQEAVPPYRGTTPYQQIPFQYSLHILERDGTLSHREFLADPDGDPRRALAESLCADIPTDVCVTAYNKAFECGRIKELAAAFPDLAAHLTAIEAHIVDLLVPFQSGCYYNRAMGGSFSIKSVLPALFPDDDALDYHRLDGVHNGGEAMALFPQMKAMSPAERETARRQLLAYCKLDTLAMVKLYEKLTQAVGGHPSSP